VKLSETVTRWFGRVEVVIAGAENALRDAEEALAVGDAMRARSAAHALLNKLPKSPIGLALLADACELGGLDAELAMTLEELAQRVGSRADIWLRLGRARQKTEAPQEDVRDAWLRGLAVAEAGSEVRKETLLALADLDLAIGDGARADLWLDRLADDKANEVRLRRAEARLAEGDYQGAERWLTGFEGEIAHGRAALAIGRARSAAHDAAAFPALLRAMLLDEPGASEALSSALGYLASDEAMRERIRTVVEGKEEGHLLRWRAAFARADGRRGEARAALLDAVKQGDTAAARPLLEAGLEDQDRDAVAAALPLLDGATDAAVSDARVILDALAAGSAEFGRLDATYRLTSDTSAAWGAKLRRDVTLELVPAAGLARWNDVLPRLERHARNLADLESLSLIGTLALERTRPLRVAIVGEFNAGKSTFINALLGADVAPTGILPTTGTLHHLRYAPSPIAKIYFFPGPTGAVPEERIIPVGELRATLKSLDTSLVRRVEILEPLPSLTRVEILDTPGFNAPDPRHAEAARESFEEADAVIWLLDAAQALKNTEREVLDEVKRARLPIQILVNKADRLAEADLARVMALVESALVEIGIESHAPPLALSAKLALEGKLGNAEAATRSGWAAVQELLDQKFEGKSDELKERALRRRAARIVGRLGGRAAERADEERRRDTKTDERSQNERKALARLEAKVSDIAVEVAAGLAEPAARWQRDLSMVAVGRDTDAVAKDSALLDYSVERALEHLALPLAQGLSRAAEPSQLTPGDLLPMARAMVRTLASTTGPLSQDAVPLEPLARAAVHAVAERLVTGSLRERKERDAEARLLELQAFADALA